MIYLPNMYNENKFEENLLKVHVAELKKLIAHRWNMIYKNDELWYIIIPTQLLCRNDFVSNLYK